MASSAPFWLRHCASATPIYLSGFVRYQYLVEITAMAENLASHKYDVAKGITIGSAFLTKAGYSSFNEIQNLSDFLKLTFFSENHHR